MSELSGNSRTGAEQANQSTESIFISAGSLQVLPLSVERDRKMAIGRLPGSGLLGLAAANQLHKSVPSLRAAMCGSRSSWTVSAIRNGLLHVLPLSVERTAMIRPPFGQSLFGV